MWGSLPAQALPLPEAENPPEGPARWDICCSGLWVPPSQGSVPAPERFPPSARLPVGAVIWLGCLMATKSLQEFWALHLHPSLLRARERSQ